MAKLEVVEPSENLIRSAYLQEKSHEQDEWVGEDWVVLIINIYINQNIRRVSLLQMQW